MFEPKEFSCDQLFTIQQVGAWDGNASWADLAIRHKRIVARADLVGPGIYACFYENKLIYVGQYRGRNDDPFSGNVARLRWDKHIGTFTMRGRNVSMGRTVLERILASPDGALAPGLSDALVDTVIRDRGMVSAFNRACFAQMHWKAFSKFGDAMLSRFSFSYVRVSPSSAFATLSTGEIRGVIADAEASLISALRPFCNVGSDVLLPAADIDASVVKPMIIDALQSAFDLATHKLVEKDIGVETPQIEDASGEPASWQDNFMGRLLGDRSELFVEQVIDGVSDEHEVYFTGTSGGDLRIRCIGGRVLLTVKWAGNRLLQCQSLASPEECRQCGFEEAGPPNPGETTMKSRFHVDPASEDAQKLLLVVSKSALVAGL